MKALWALETRVFMKGARREANNFAMNFAIKWMRLIGLKSKMSSAPSFFGINVMSAEFIH